MHKKILLDAPLAWNITEEKDPILKELKWAIMKLYHKVVSNALVFLLLNLHDWRLIWRKQFWHESVYFEHVFTYLKANYREATEGQIFFWSSYLETLSRYIVKVNNKNVNESLNVFKVTNKATRTTSTDLLFMHLLATCKTLIILTGIR